MRASRRRSAQPTGGGPGARRPSGRGASPRAIRAAARRWSIDANRESPPHLKHRLPRDSCLPPNEGATRVRFGSRPARSRADRGSRRRPPRPSTGRAERAGSPPRWRWRRPAARSARRRAAPPGERRSRERSRPAPARPATGARPAGWPARAGRPTRAPRAPRTVPLRGPGAPGSARRSRARKGAERGRPAGRRRRSSPGAAPRVPRGRATSGRRRRR